MTKRNFRRVAKWVLAATAAVGGISAMPMPAWAEKAAAADITKVDADFACQGEYAGDIGGKKFGAQVIALGGGNFRAVFYPGGLPGDGWEKTMKKSAAEGKVADGKVTIKGDPYGCEIKEKSLALLDNAGKELGKLPQVLRKSPTLGAKPPEGAIVLFDGKNADEWREGAAKLTEDGLLMQGSNSKKLFGSGKLHVEFMLAYEPRGRGQGRSNSGVYLQGRYEIQVLDSFGLDGMNNECGGIYSVSEPIVNMCFPPLSWQTYDVEFTAARWDNGKKTANAQMTVLHNGVLVQKDAEIPHPTTAAPAKETADPSYLYLQEHGSPVRFRNIWFVEAK
ncbi:MAG: DUF1080 domain-containing protein [Tepidisphaeraceae bacterium]|jgi:hypothetical protein